MGFIGIPIGLTFIVVLFILGGLSIMWEKQQIIERKIDNIAKQMESEMNEERKQ